MGSIITALLKAMNVGQLVAFFFTTLAPIVIGAVVPAGPIHDSLISLCASIGALLMVLLRKPSAEGGTVSTATK